MGCDLENKKIDIKIAALLMDDATVTSQQIGESVGLSTSAANERVRKMKKDGHIKKIAAVIDGNFLDIGLGAIVSVWVEGGDNDVHFPERIGNNPHILECHRVTGECSYVLKVRCKNTVDFDWLTSCFLKSQPGVTKTVSQVILSSPKENSLIVC